MSSNSPRTLACGPTRAFTTSPLGMMVGSPLETFLSTGMEMCTALPAWLDNSATALFMNLRHSFEGKLRIILHRTCVGGCTPLGAFVRLASSMTPEELQRVNRLCERIQMEKDTS